MTSSPLVCWPVFLLAGFCLFVNRLPAADGQPSDLKFRAQLIWGTDEDKPKDKPKIKELDPKLRENMRKLKLFRWKNYYEIDQENFRVPENGNKISSISRKCVIEVTHLGNADIEVKLYGEGKLVQTVRQALPMGEHLILAGHDKEKYNDCWLVALSQVEK